MVYQLSDRLAHLTKRLRGGDDTALEGIDSRLVEVRRDGSLLFSANASVRELRVDEKIMYGISLDARRIDFLFTRDQIPHGYIPEVIDTITEPISGLNCQVQPAGEATWRWTTHRHTTMRVHTAAEAYTLTQAEAYFSPVYIASTVGSIQVATETLPLSTLFTKSLVGTVMVEADIDTTYTKSTAGTLEPDEG